MRVRLRNDLMRVFIQGLAASRSYFAAVFTVYPGLVLVSHRSRVLFNFAPESARNRSWILLLLKKPLDSFVSCKVGLNCGG